MQFSIRSTLGLTALVALLSAISIHRLAVALFLASFVPLILYLSFARRGKRTYWSLARRYLVAAVLVTPTYVLSVGPYFFLYELFPFWDPPPKPFTKLFLSVGLLYRPLNPMLELGVLDHQIQWYLESWSDDGHELYNHLRYTETSPKC